MKFATITKTTITKTMTMGLALLLASSASAATKANLQLHNPTVINGTKLKPGEYKLEWDGSGPNVEVSIMQGKNVLAKTAGKVVDLGSPAQNTAAVTRQNGDGSVALTGARFEGKKYALELGDANDSMQAGSSR
jgi:hypothetical protein